MGRSTKLFHPFCSLAFKRETRGIAAAWLFAPFSSAARKQLEKKEKRNQCDAPDLEKTALRSSIAETKFLFRKKKKMKRADYPEPIKELIAQLKRMPGIGPRSAERIALWMNQSRDAHPVDIASAIRTASEQVRPCAKCGFFTTATLCEICSDETRCGEQLCVVEQATDILPIERTGVFRGRYHALGGRISPLDHVGPEDLRIDALLNRIAAESPREVILALGADVEGEATANYIAELLRNRPGVTVTRIAQGLPAGVGLETADELTLSRALAGRREVS